MNLAQSLALLVLFPIMACSISHSAGLKEGPHVDRDSGIPAPLPARDAGLACTGLGETCGEGASCCEGSMCTQSEICEACTATGARGDAQCCNGDWPNKVTGVCDPKGCGGSGDFCSASSSCCDGFQCVVLPENDFDGECLSLPQAEICDDSFDNDGNGFADCSDFACRGVGACA